MNSRILMMGAMAVVLGCSSMGRQGKIEQFVAHDVDATNIKRVAVIAGGSRRGDMQVLARARDRLTKAGVPIVRRPGSWDSNTDAVKELCVQKTEADDNVDGVIIVTWDRLVLHACPGGAVATAIDGSYAGIDALVDRLVRFMGVLPPEKT